VVRCPDHTRRAPGPSRPDGAVGGGRQTDVRTSTPLDIGNLRAPARGYSRSRP